MIALLHPEISHVYLASGFSAYETENYAVAPHAYALGERLQIERVSVLAALFDRKVRLSYGRSENAVYRKEAQDRLVLDRVKRYWQRLNAADRLTQLTHDGGHVYVAEEYIAVPDTIALRVPITGLHCCLNKGMERARNARFS